VYPQGREPCTTLQARRVLNKPAYPHGASRLSSANTNLKTPLDVEGGVFDVGNNTAELSSAVKGTPDDPKKLTKRELLELADYLYGRYQASKKPLYKGHKP
jgi:hypothetical protein